jgi:hypothetical protein
VAKRLNTEEKTRAAVELASGKSIRQVAKGLKRSAATICLLSRDPATREQIETLRGEIATELEDLAVRALTNITDQKLQKTSAYQNTLIAGIAAQRSSELRNLDPVKPPVKINIRINFDPRNAPEGYRDYAPGTLKEIEIKAEDSKDE